MPCRCECSSRVILSEVCPRPITLEQVRQHVTPILRQHGVRHAAVFGSVARGEATDASDLDLLVDLPPGSSLLDLVGLQQELQDMFGIRVDVVSERARMHPRVRASVDRDKVVVL